MQASPWIPRGATALALLLSAGCGSDVRNDVPRCELAEDCAPGLSCVDRVCVGELLDTGDDSSDPCAYGACPGTILSVSDHIDDANMQNCHPFTLRVPASVVILTTPTLGQPTMDTEIWLGRGTSRCDNSDYIEWDDDGGSGLYSRIAIDLEPGDYQVGVQHYGGYGRGSYTLEVRVVE